MKIQYVIAIHLMRWVTNFYDFRFKATSTKGIGIHPTKVWLSQLVNWKNALGTLGHLPRRICNTILFITWKNASETYGMLQTVLNNLAWIEHQLFSGIRDRRTAGNLWGMMRGVGGIRKSIHQNWLTKGLELGLLCWGFKGVQVEILSEETSTLQIGSVVFPPGQCTCSQPHPCHRLFDQDEHQDSSSPPIVQTLLPVSFAYSLSSVAVVMRQLRRWKRLCQRSLTRWHKRTSMGPSRIFGTVQQVHCSRRRLPEGD